MLALAGILALFAPIERSDLASADGNGRSGQAFRRRPV
jgi:hypothetical protein